MAAGEVMIKELPRILCDEVKDTDLLLIENQEDTYCIRVSDLKVVCSADEKISAVQDSLTKLIEQNRTEVDSSIQGINEKLNNYNTIITGNSDSLEELKKKVLLIQQDITDLEDKDQSIDGEITKIYNTLSSHGNTIASNTQNITELKQTAIDFENRITVLEQLGANHGTRLLNLEDNFSEYTENTDQKIEDLVAADITVLGDSKNYTDEKYDDVMKYIDYYHHYHENPPNFDEPYYYERELAGYVYPIGSLYHTTNESWDPTNYKVPGVWELVGKTTLGTVTDPISGEVSNPVEEYIYERIE